MHLPKYSHQNISTSYIFHKWNIFISIAFYHQSLSWHVYVTVITPLSLPYYSYTYIPYSSLNLIIYMYIRIKTSKKIIYQIPSMTLYNYGRTWSPNNVSQGQPNLIRNWVPHLQHRSWCTSATATFYLRRGYTRGKCIYHYNSHTSAQTYVDDTPTDSIHWSGINTKQFFCLWRKQFLLSVNIGSDSLGYIHNTESHINNFWLDFFSVIYTIAQTVREMTGVHIIPSSLP